MTRAKDISKILTDADISGTLDVTGETTLATHLNMGDGDIIKLGASADLTIQHDGSRSIIQDSGTGNLRIQANNLELNNADNSENYLFASADGQVELYHNNVKKFETTSSGVDVTGGVTYTGDLISSTSGTSNFRAGVNAGNSIASGGNYNVVIGDEAGTALTTGDKNTAIGFEALKTEDGTGANVAVGYRALKTQNAGGDAHNTAVGNLAGEDVTTGTANTLLGSLSGMGLTTGGSNTALGYNSLEVDTAGSKTVAIGFNALQDQNFSSATDSNNTAVGYNAGLRVTTGIKNTIMGGLAGDALTDADRNVAVGEQALTVDTLGSRSTALGWATLSAQNFTSATDSYNVGVGYFAGGSITTGLYNTIVGGLAGDSLTDADRNTAVGMQSLSADTQGSKSTAVGYAALGTQNFTSATDSHNTAVGNEAGVSVTTGLRNTLVGAEAGDGITTGSRNTAVGYQALSGAVDDGQYNTCVGTASGLATTGEQNTFVGAYDPHTGGSGAQVTSGSKNTVLGSYNGNQDSLDIRTSDNNCILSDGDGNVKLWISSNRRTFIGGRSTNLAGAVNIAGEIGASFKAISFSRTNGGSQVGSIVTNTSTTSYNTSSDYRLKENVVDMTGAIDRVKQLSPKRFNFIIDADKTVDGFLAHEAQTVIPESVSGEKDAVDDNGDIDAQGIDQSKLVPLLTGALKEAIAKIETLEADVKALKGE